MPISCVWTLFLGVLFGLISMGFWSSLIIVWVSQSLFFFMLFLILYSKSTYFDFKETWSLMRSLFNFCNSTILFLSFYPILWSMVWYYLCSFYSFSYSVSKMSFSSRICSFSNYKAFYFKYSFSIIRFYSSICLFYASSS